MAEYISKAETYKALTDYYHLKTRIQLEALEEALGRVPTIDMDPTKRARNIYHTEPGHCEFKCSECGATLGEAAYGTMDGGTFKFCPNCGLPLEEEK